MSMSKLGSKATRRRWCRRRPRQNLLLPLEELPWRVSTPDWSVVGVVRLNLDSPQFWNALQRTKFGQFNCAFLMYDPAEPGIIAPLRELVDSVDELTWKAPGVRFLCGVVRRENRWTLEPDAFAAYDGGDHLLVRVVRIRVRAFPASEFPRFRGVRGRAVLSTRASGARKDAHPVHGESPSAHAAGPDLHEAVELLLWTGPRCG